MTERLVTIVRRRVVIDEAVITEKEFNEINSLSTDEECHMAYERLTQLPYDTWDIKEDECYEDAYMAFAGDVRAFSDDLVSLSSNWNSLLPLELDSASYFDKLLAR
jgi:hypothetical protein